MSDKNYVLLQDSIVINIVSWDGVSEVDFGDGVDVEPLADGVAANKGYSYKDGIFTAPALTDEQVAAQAAQAMANNETSKTALMDAASQTISVLQDAVDLEMATDAETSSLLEWKKYRILLSRIDSSTSEAISWPVIPVTT